MKKRVEIFAFAGIMMHMTIVPMLEGKKLSMQPKMRNIQQFVHAESKEEKQQKALGKKTHEKLKSAREQYKKQLARLIDLLAQADELGRGTEESETTTKDLKDFFGNLGGMYTSVVDSITGAGDYKKKISELEKNKTQLLALIQALKVQLDQRNALVKELQAALQDQKNKNDVSLQHKAQLESEKALWLEYLNNLESCVITIKEGKKESEDAGKLVEQMLISAYQKFLNIQISKD